MFFTILRKLVNHDQVNEKYVRDMLEEQKNRIYRTHYPVRKM